MNAKAAPQNTDAEDLRDRPKETRRYVWHYTTEEGNRGVYYGPEHDEAAVSARFYERFGLFLSELKKVGGLR